MVHPRIVLKTFGKNSEGDSVNLSKAKSGCKIWDELTLRSVLSVFVTGQGVTDTKDQYACLNLATADNFDKVYEECSPYVGKKIRTVVKSEMREAFLEEIYATIDELYSHRMSEFERAIEKSKWKNNDSDRMVISITVSYDMGWQKRSSGKIFLLCIFFVLNYFTKTLFYSLVHLNVHIYYI